MTRFILKLDPPQNNNLMQFSNPVDTSSTRIPLNKIEIISVNVSSIISNQKRFNIINLIKKCNPDIVLLNETKLNNRHNFQVENYTILREDRSANNKGGGGTAILIKNIFKHVKIELKSKLKSIETCIIKLNLPQNQNLFIISAYAAKNTKDNFLNDLNIIIKELKLFDSQNWYILAGDLNANHPDWRGYTENQRGVYLKNWLQNNDLTHRIKLLGLSEPTYPAENSFLDICLLDYRITLNNAVNGKLKVVPYDSDHNALKMSFALTELGDLTLERTPNPHKFNYDKVNWEDFQQFFDSYTSNIPENINLSNDEIDSHLQALNDLILEAINSTVPKIKISTSLNKYLTPKIKETTK